MSGMLRLANRCREALAAATVAVVVAACEPAADPTPAATDADEPGLGGPAWRDAGGSLIVAVDDEVAAALDAAAAEARRTAPAARARWVAAADDERDRWAVKWAAPTADGGIEHVWVLPAAWTDFRIEGILASPPGRPLRCGRTLGEPVGFAAEQLSDWVRGIDDPAAREGGYTLRVLDEMYGRPDPGGSRDAAPASSSRPGSP